MLSWNQVLSYVKANLALPSTYIEKTDQELQDYISLTALKEFSKYIPDVERCLVYTDDTSVNTYKVDGYSNRYYIFDEEDLPILGIKEVYFSLSNEIMTGHPLVGPLTFEGMQWFALSIFKSNFLRSYSDFDYTFKFFFPNIVEVLPADRLSDNGSFLVEYLREQPHSLEKIPPEMDMDMMDLSLAHCLINIGNIRSNYGDGQIETPFGTINIQGESLRTRGEDIRQRIVERLIEASVPPVIVDIN